MATTKIEWATKVWNPVTGCTKISEGCEHCYAEKFANRMKNHPNPAISDKYQNGFKPTVHENVLYEPFKWQKHERIFVCSMGDLFHQDIPFEFIDRVMATIALNNKHTFMVLTKRPDIMFKYFVERVSQRTFLDKENYIKSAHDKVYEAACKIHNVNTVFDLPISTDWPINNLWLGVTAENQQLADERIPILLQIPAVVRFVSVEPMLGPVNVLVSMAIHYYQCMPFFKPNRIDWVICGGETGPGARAVNPDWVTSLKDQCEKSSVPFFFKQWGGKNRSSQIDGQEYKQFPKPKAVNTNSHTYNSQL